MEAFTEYLLDEMIENIEIEERAARRVMFKGENNSFSINKKKRNKIRDKRSYLSKKGEKKFWNNVPLFKKKEEERKDVMAILGKPFRKNAITEDQMIKNGLQDFQDQRVDEARAESEFWMEEEESFCDHWWVEFSDTEENERRAEERRLDDLYYEAIEDFDFIY